MKNEQLNITVTPDISIDELVALHEQGYSIQRSAHIGNMQPYNMTLIAAGIPTILVDHTVTDKDKTYRPEQIMQNLESEIIADLGTLASRTMATIDGQANYLDELHMTSLSQAIPAANIKTTTAYARVNESIFQTVTAAAIDVMPEIFNRTIHDQTVLKESSPRVSALRAAALVKDYGIMQLNDDPRIGTAVMLPNEVDIIANFIIEALESGSDTIYHLSGPDMCSYAVAKDMYSRLGKLYAASANQPGLRGRLPAQLHVKLIPAADARFATTSTRSADLRALTSAIGQLSITEQIVRAEKARFFKSAGRDNPDQKTRVIQACNEKLRQVQDNLTDALLDSQEVIANYRKQPFITQYDVIEEGGLYVDPINTSLSMQELSSIVSTIRKLARSHSHELA